MDPVVEAVAAFVSAVEVEVQSILYLVDILAILRKQYLQNLFAMLPPKVI